MKVPETQIGKIAVAWLKDRGYEVFEEVTPLSSLNRIDIVARLGKIIVAVECKSSLNTIVAEQASRWRGHANYVFVCAPRPKNYNQPGLSVVKYYCRQHGIGVMLCDVQHGYLEIDLDAKLWRDRTKYLERSLDGHTPNTGNAGCKINEDSDWKLTCKRLFEYVAKHPGCTIKEAMTLIAHHYRTDNTARSSMTHWLGLGKVKGVVAEKHGGKYLLYPTPASEEYQK